MNIPIYRAKKIASDEYVTGDLHIHKIEQVVGKRYIKETSYYILTHRKIDSNPNSFDGMYITDTMICTKIDPTTLAIHFPDMLDSQGNKIFASLGKDGKGGDILKCYLGSNIENCTFREMTFKYQSLFRFTIGMYDINAYPVICKVGIQE